MKKVYPAAIEAARIKQGRMASDQFASSGAFTILFGSTKTVLHIIVGSAEDFVKDGMLSVLGSPPWDHVSVSCEKRTPTWEEMTWVKNQFFDPEECVVQFHPPQSKYVNFHPNVLHMWHMVGAEFPMPPIECV